MSWLLLVLAIHCLYMVAKSVKWLVKNHTPSTEQVWL